MNKKIVLFAGLPLLFFAFTGCNSIGAKGASLSVVYGVAMAAALLALLGIPISYIGFDRIVSVIYPIFGFVGIMFWIALAQTGRKIV